MNEPDHNLFNGQCMHCQLSSGHSVRGSPIWGRARAACRKAENIRVATCVCQVMRAWIATYLADRIPDHIPLSVGPSSSSRWSPRCCLRGASCASKKRQTECNASRRHCRESWLAAVIPHSAKRVARLALAKNLPL